MTPQEQFLEMTEHLGSDARPSAYLKHLLAAGSLEQYPFSMLSVLEKTPQSPIHHPEGSVWNHVCLVVDQAALVKVQSRDPITFMWAALLHDIGKPATTKERRGKITSYDHDKVGMRLTREFLSALTDDKAWIERVSKLVLYHMQLLFVVKNMPFAKISSMKRDTDVREVALLGYCDRMGRTNSNAQDERVYVHEFLQKCGVQESRARL